MEIIFGLLAGIAVGAAQLFLLARFVSAVTAGRFDTRAALGGITVLFAPFAALGIIAFLYIDALAWAGLGAGAALTVGAAVWFVIKRGKTR